MERKKIYSIGSSSEHRVAKQRTSRWQHADEWAARVADEILVEKSESLKFRFRPVP